MASRHHAVLLYKTADAIYSERLWRALEDRGISVWYGDVHVRRGGRIATAISEALGACKYVFVCVGPSGVGDYFRNIELSAITYLASQSQTEVVLIYVGEENDYGPKNPPEVLLGGFRSTDLRKGIEGNRELELLVRDVKEAYLQKEPQPPGVGDGKLEEKHEVGDARARDVARAKAIAQDIANRLEDGEFGLTVGIGPHWPGTTMPSSEEVALDLLSKTLSWDTAARQTFSAAPLMPPETAALYYSLAGRLDVDSASKNIVQKFIGPRSIGEPKTFVTLARLMAKVAENCRADYGRAVVFTTNIDSSLERAFVAAETAFILIIVALDDQNDERVRFLRTEFPASEARGEGRMWRSAGREYCSLALADLRPHEREKYEIAFSSSIWSDEHAAVRVTLSEFVRSCELNKEITRFVKDNGVMYEDMRPRGGPELPVVVKLLGSHLMPSTAIVSCDLHFRLARVLSSIGKHAETTVRNNACLIAGHYLCDPVFRLLFDVVLREGFGYSGHQRRYALLPKSDAKANGVGALRQAVEQGLRESSFLFSMKLEVDLDPGDLFSALRDLVTEQGGSHWA